MSFVKITTDKNTCLNIPYYDYERLTGFDIKKAEEVFKIKIKEVTII